MEPSHVSPDSPRHSHHLAFGLIGLRSLHAQHQQPASTALAVGSLNYTQTPTGCTPNNIHPPSDPNNLPHNRMTLFYVSPSSFPLFASPSLQKRSSATCTQPNNSINPLTVGRHNYSQKPTACIRNDADHYITTTLSYTVGRHSSTFPQTLAFHPHQLPARLIGICPLHA